MKLQLVTDKKEFAFEVEFLREAVESLEENCDDFTAEDFDEVRKIYKKLEKMVKGK